MPQAPHRDIALISVSIDLGAGRRGVDMGPSALRIAGITGEIEAIGHRVTELGTITAGGLETTEAGVTRNLRFLSEIEHVVTQIGRVPRCGSGLERNCTPLVLGEVTIPFPWDQCPRWPTTISEAGGVESESSGSTPTPT